RRPKPLNTVLYLSSCVYIDEEHWQKGWNDVLETRHGAKWLIFLAFGPVESNSASRSYILFRSAFFTFVGSPVSSIKAIWAAIWSKVYLAFVKPQFWKKG